MVRAKIILKMAKTWQDCYDELIAQKNSISELDELNSTSNTAIYKLWISVMAMAYMAMSYLFEEHKTEVDLLVASAPAGTPAWYAQKSLEFQLGDDIQVINNVTSYPIGSTGEKIVTRAVAKNTIEGFCAIKVAKGTAGALQPLDSSEFTQFKAYIDKIQFGGAWIDCINLPADLLTLIANITYDAIYNPDEVKANVIVAVNQFLANMPFDGLLYREKLRDAIQAVTGVVDVEITSLTATSEGIIYSIGQLYELRSGYVNINPSTTLDDTLTMVAA